MNLNCRTKKKLGYLSLGLLVAVVPAQAIVRWNEGKDQIFVTGSFSMAWDSNIYTSANQTSDIVYTATLGAEYRRRAGLIGINVSSGLARAQFSENVSESSTNPNLRIELNKDTGRTTGTLGLSASRSARADPTVNLRTDSWNYTADLNLKYPISDRHALTASLTWHKQDYLDNQLFVDLTSISMSADWFYVFTPQRDLFGGYRLRISESSAQTTFADHSISAGVSGRIVRGLNGTARVGYQVREGLKGTSETFSGYNASLSAAWNFTRKVALNTSISKDFNITSTNLSTDALTGNLDLQYARSAKLALTAGVGAGRTTYLGTEGDGREDTFFTAYGRIAYTFNEHLRLGLVYSYFRNWSTIDFSDFSRNSLTFDASSRF